jgi:iron complex outermembrane receptor protein
MTVKISNGFSGGRCKSLNEVVIQVGYGTVKKKDATGAVSQISSKDFNKGQNVTPESLISGRIAVLM